MKKWVTNLAAAIPLVVLAGGAFADDMNFNATLSGDQETPDPVVTDASGSATLTLNAAQDELTYHIEFENLSSPETNAHFHNAPAGVSGGAVFNLGVGNPKDGVWNIPPDMVTELLAGNIYINIHSEKHQGGEIRGQVEKNDPTPIVEATWGRIKDLYRD